MRLSRKIILFAVLLMLAGCAVPPFDIKVEAPNLNIASKRPLKVAVVVPDPMPYTFLYNGEKGYRRDSTADVRSMGFPIERDLSKVVSETLSQAFDQVVVLRDLPQPGQYDAVVNLNIGMILLQEHVIVTGETCDLTVEWAMSVLDGQNRELMTKKGISPSRNFKFSIMTPSRDLVLGVNEHLPVILNGLAKDWGTTLYALDIPVASGEKQ
ncbi:MAG: hypothetical protein HZB85_05010 [Deltaproteobacteria bacterium]|nr:hypothetical protein [Deltaproteobacteria bacterium]